MSEFLVGACTVRPETGEVLCGDTAAHLEPKSMAVLVHLIARRGEVVSRDELLDLVWPGIHVGDDSLTAAIIKVRRALGDDARNPTYVETIPKRGYRLVAEVQPVAAEPLRQGGSRVLRSPRRASVAAVAAILALVLAGLIWFRPAPGRDDLARPRSGDRTTIAVAPFQNAGRDPAQDYLARGIGDTILGDLARVPEVSVRPVADPQAGPAGADYMLAGSVLRSGEVIRIDARLVDGDSGDVVAALRFDRPFDDLLSIEDEIRDTVLARLVGSINAAEKSRRARGYTDNVQAYDLFLQAQRELLVRTRETNLAARDLYRQAIAAAPDFARAYGGLALTYAADYRNGWAAGDTGSLDNAARYAQTALGISPDLPEQHWVIGYVRTQQRRFAEARAELRSAIDLDPGYADAFALAGGIETYRGNPAASVPLLREAMRLNPAAGYLYFLLLARAYYFLDDFEQAEINLDEALARNPENIEAHLYLAATLARLGRAEDAAWETTEVQSIEPDFDLDRWNVTYPMERGAQLRRLMSDLRAVGFS